MQTFGNSLLVDFNALIENKLTLESWFILYCLSNNKKDLIDLYTTNCNKFKLEQLKDLELRGFLVLKTNDNITIDSLRLTVKGKEVVLGKNKTEDEQFEELFKKLRETYPKKVPSENGSFRPLHGDLSRCRRLYYKILYKDGKFDSDLHVSILKAIDKEVKVRSKGGNLPFMQALVTYLHQQNYSLYIDLEEEVVRDKGDDI